MPIKELCLAILLLASAASAAAQSPPTAEQVARFLEGTRATLKHPRRGATVQRQEVEVGKRADGSPLMIDLTVPKDARKNQSLPVAILLHGGLPNVPSRPRQWQVYRDWGTVIADAGAAAIMFDHTLGAPPARLDQALTEVDAVLRWLTDQGAARGLDAKRVTAATFSAGGLLVPALLTEPRAAQLRSVVMFYPLVGVNSFNGGAITLEKALVERMSLRTSATSVAARSIPLLIFRAGKDEIPGLLTLLDAAITALLAADARVEVVNLPGMPHSFDMFSDAPQVRDSIGRAIDRISAPR
jgi:acetyl esterase/lipase